MTSPTHIEPGRTTLYLSDVAALFDLKPNTIRQYIRRGNIPEPTSRRDPELGWDAAVIYAWAQARDLMPLNAVPFRYLRHVITTNDIPGPTTPQVRSVQVRTNAPSGNGIVVDYGDLTYADLGFTLYYAHAFHALSPSRETADIVVQVDSDASPHGFYVSVEQTHPDYRYAEDSQLFTRDVAELVGAPIPYWTHTLRFAARGIDRSTGHILRADGAVPMPDDPLTARLATSVEAYVEEHPDQDQLNAALRATVAHHYRGAAENAQWDIDKYAKPHEAASWVLNDPAHHLFIAATPLPPEDESPEAELARTSLPDLLWTTPVGSTPTARRLAADIGYLGETLSFTEGDETTAQSQFLSALVPVAFRDATLTHLHLTHPRYGSSLQGQRLYSTFWRDPISGALATIFNGTFADDPREIVYIVPEDYPTTVGVETFDFASYHQPFIWTTDGNAAPFPSHPDSGYALGYGGSGPRAVMGTAAKLLGITPGTPPSARSPLLHKGYPTRISANEMRALYKESLA